MTKHTPRNADEFVEQQLDERALALGVSLGADVLGFIGPLVDGVDDAERAQAFGNIRAAAEYYGIDLRAKSWRDLAISCDGTTNGRIVSSRTG